MTTSPLRLLLGAFLARASTWLFQAGRAVLNASAAMAGIEPAASDRAQALPQPAAPTAPAEQARPQWHALPGSVLELADTGFQIRLVCRSGVQPYWLYDPEGDLIVRHIELAPLKAYAELKAAERRSFECAVRPRTF